MKLKRGLMSSGKKLFVSRVKELYSLSFPTGPRRPARQLRRGHIAAGS